MHLLWFRSCITKVELLAFWLRSGQTCESWNAREESCDVKRGRIVEVRSWCILWPNLESTVSWRKLNQKPSLRIKLSHHAKIRFELHFCFSFIQARFIKTFRLVNRYISSRLKLLLLLFCLEKSITNPLCRNPNFCDLPCIPGNAYRERERTQGRGRKA